MWFIIVTHEFDCLSSFSMFSFSFTKPGVMPWEKAAQHRNTISSTNLLPQTPPCKPRDDPHLHGL